MGGRGSYSYSGGERGGRGPGEPLQAFAVASLNKGTAGGTSPEAAVARFREQLMDSKYEHSAFIDDNGYVHALGSTKQEGRTKVASLSTVAKQKGVSSIIHNHPFGGSDGRKYGGPLSKGDLRYIAQAYAASNGKVNRMIATSNEGTYSARVTKSVSLGQVDRAARKADASLKGKNFRSEKAMWRAVNDAYTKEFGKIGINISYDKQAKRSKKLVTQRTGTYSTGLL